MGENGKRKEGPGGSHGGRPQKMSKGGKDKRWKTPHQEAKESRRLEMGKSLDVGDQGLWVTFARNMRQKAMREFVELCEQYGKDMYGIEPPSEKKPSKQDEEEEEEDIEASIAKEMDDMKAPRKPQTRQTFTPVKTNLECLFFLKTMEPVRPLELVQKICKDARECPDPRQRKLRYINRLTPVFDTERATEVGIEKVARGVLGGEFGLVDGGEKVEGEGEESTACTYAIRHNIRNNTTFKSSAVIQQIAGLIKPTHKVNLTKPDKVILVEIFQTFCGMSVVDGGEWEELKRYNVNELYQMTGKGGKGEQKGGEDEGKVEAKGSEETEVKS